jgi:Secretion system C-terminal sorting domain
MKKIFSIISLACLPIIMHAQTLHNNGAIFYVSPGATVHINANVKNEAGSQWLNKGTVNITGNFTNNQAMPPPTSGTTRFDGTALQTVSGNEALQAYDVVFQNHNGIKLNNAIIIDNAAYFYDGIVDATSNAVLFNTNSSMGNTPSDSSHIKGYMAKVGSGPFTYPVGDGLRYQPITLDLSVNPDGMGVQYFASNAGSGTFSNTGSDTTPLVSYNASEYWELSSSNATGTVTMYWDDYNNPGINNPADLKVAHLKTGQWRNEGTNASGTTSSGSVTSNVSNTWSPFTLGQVKATIPLSIAINNFNVAKTDIANLISWQTNTENNNDFFTIQKSADGINFTNLSDVKSKAANGNSSTLINYNFNDAQPFVGANYYRLTQTDFNGSSKISSEVKVVYWNTAAHVSVYPNPVVNNLNINYTAAANGVVEMRLYDALGKVAASKTVSATKGMNIYTMDMEKFALGNYQLRVENGNGSHIFKIVKQ